MWPLPTRSLNSLIVVMDSAVIFLAYVMSAVIQRQRDMGGGGPESDRFHLLFTALPVWVAFFFVFRLYRSRRLQSVFADCFSLLAGFLFGAVLLVGIFPSLLGQHLSFFATFTLLSWVTLTMLRIQMRFFLRWLRRRGINQKRLLIVGSGSITRELADRIQHNSFFGYTVEMITEPRSAIDPTATNGLLWQEVSRELEGRPPDEVIITSEPGNEVLAQRLLAACESRAIPVRIAFKTGHREPRSGRLQNLDGILISNPWTYPSDRLGYLLGKRTLDLLLGALLLVVLSPVMLLIALAVKLSSTGPVLFRQQRLGLNGRRFWMYKFRTMTCQPEALGDLLWTTPQDPRVTRLGRFLRRNNLDELPQLFNVLQGDMSLVGPRPERPYFARIFQQQIPGYMARHYLKGGITGWAQVNGWRGDTSIPKRLEFDLYYLRNWRLTLDFKILWLTLFRGFGRNAY
ncbi:MAG: exopolysaccharide biosynthesis polyprenyl glycosylphosphotransferase [Acidobacteriota bacterium]